VIDGSALADCQNLVSVGFEGGGQLTRIEPFAFVSSGVKSFLVTSSVQTLGENCFAKCVALTAVMFEEQCVLRVIEKAAFEQCGVRQIVIPGTVEKSDARRSHSRAFAPSHRSEM
jgi:hypothetical protein